MTISILLGMLAVLHPLSVSAEQWEDMPWPQRWAASDSIFHLAYEAQQADHLDSALVLFNSALQTHPSNYKAYYAKWHLLRRIAVRDSLTKEEVADLIKADVEVMHTRDHTDDQIYVLSFGYDYLFELTEDETFRVQQRRTLEDYLVERPENHRAQDFFCTLARIAESPEKALSFYKQALSKHHESEPSPFDIYKDMITLGMEFPSLMPTSEMVDLFQRWETEIHSSILDQSDEQKEVDRLHAKFFEK